MKGASTIDAVTDRTGLGRGTVQRIKEGRTSVGTDVLVSIADAFEIDMPQLLAPNLKLAKSIEPHAPAIHFQQATPSAHSIGEMLAAKLQPMDKGSREVAGTMLKAISERPDDAARLIDALTILLGEFPDPRENINLKHA